MGPPSPPAQPESVRQSSDHQYDVSQDDKGNVHPQTVFTAQGVEVHP